MLSIAPLAKGPGYYLELANINYYLEGGEPLPLWVGTAAHELGLSGIAEREHVERLCAGFHHETGTKLVRNAGKESRNAGHDCTFSCPKTVSIAWALADTETRKAIEQVQLSAVRQALQYLEDKAAYARLGRQGQELVRAPLLGVLFEHGTSRAKDPQLHTHALILNLTMHADGHTTALDSTYLYHFKMAAGAVYRAALAHGLLKLGFSIVQRDLGASMGFELEGIPGELVEEFSKRRAEIEQELKLRAGSLDAASPKYAEVITKETRRTKDTEVPRHELLRDWQEVGRAYGIGPEEVHRFRSPYEKPSPEERERRKEHAFRLAISALSAQHSHWNEVELTKAVAERAPGRLSAQDVRELIENRLYSDELIHLGGLTTETKNHGQKQYVERIEERLTIPEIKALERRMLVLIERIRLGCGSETPLELVEAAIEQSPVELDVEQAEAVRYLTSGPGVRLMSGLAGTGKSTALRVCFEAWKSAGRDVLGCALAGAAAKRLERGSGIPSDTLDGLLSALDQGRIRLGPDSVIVVDEAGMVGTSHLVRLLEHVSQSGGARLCLAGDARQLQPIAAGGPFKFLADKEVLGEIRLSKIRRQEEKWAREAVRHIERGQAREALQAYIERGRFHLTEDRNEAVERMMQQWQEDGGVRSPEGVFLIAATNAETKELNLKAQAARMAAGLVHLERKLFANGVFFHIGDRLQFQKRSKPMRVENSDMATVVAVDPERERLTVQLDKDGRTFVVDLKRYEPKNLRLGYASTTHKAQGASLPIVHVLLGSASSDLHMGYVQLSRSTRSTHLFCDKHAAGGPELSDLIRGLVRLRQKTLAHEVIRNTSRRHHTKTREPVQGIPAGV